MIWIFIALILTALAADGYFWRHGLRTAALPTCAKRLAAGALLLTDLLPLPCMAVGWLLPDNPTGAVNLFSWLNLLFLCTVPTRLLCYAGWASRRRWGRVLGFAAAAGLAGALVWGTVWCRSDLRVERVEVRSHKLPESFDGLRVALFSDLHAGALLNPERETARVVDTLLSLDADLILFGGDLVNIRYTELDDAVSRQLARLKAPLGVYSVLGNHDMGVYIKDSLTLAHEVNTARLLERQRALGWRVLNDETVYLRRGGDSISFTGIAFQRSLRNFRHDGTLPDVDLTDLYAEVPDTLFNLTLCHLPQLWELITAQGFGDLTLAGHVHSMQMKIPLGRRGLSLARILYKRWSGAYTEGGRTLYINDGIGAVGIPTRLGAAPEVTLIRLRRE